VRELVGELSAAAVLMQANLDFDGTLILQLHGDGPVKLAVAEARRDLSFRATATVAGEVPADARLEALVNVQGRGRCAITLDAAQRRPGQQPYQGVVPLHGDRREPLQQLAQVLEHYMLQSAQLDTRLVLAADERSAAGLLIQRLPAAGPARVSGERDEDSIGRNEDFNRIALLAATSTREELLTLDAGTLLRRLFWEEKLRRFEPRQPRFACSCAPERVRNMLRGLGAGEVQGIVAERGQVEVGCEFCGRQYRFDAVDAAELFTPPRDQPPASSSLQ
jgi:molecular chaperone Hsp33